MTLCPVCEKYETPSSWKICLPCTVKLDRGAQKGIHAYMKYFGSARYVRQGYPELTKL